MRWSEFEYFDPESLGSNLGQLKTQLSWAVFCTEKIWLLVYFFTFIFSGFSCHLDSGVSGIEPKDAGQGFH